MSVVRERMSVKRALDRLPGSLPKSRVDESRSSTPPHRPDMATLQFLSLSSSIDPSFWHAFTKLKVDVLKLSDEPVPLTATYERARWIKDRETGQDVGVPASVRLDGNAFDQQDRHATSAAQGTVSMPGLLKNYNTIEEFKNADKQALFNSVADDVRFSLRTQGMH